MDPKTSSEIRTLLNEFDTIKSSLGPVINEVKKMHELRIELKRFKEETDSKLKKLDFELRHLAHREPPLKDVVSSKTRIDELSSQIESLRKQYSALNKETKIDKEVERQIRDSFNKMPKMIGSDERRISEELNKIKNEVKHEVTMMKGELHDVDEKHTKMMNITREKVANLVAEADHMFKQIHESMLRSSEALKNIVEFESWFKNSEKVLLHNDETAKRHNEQIVNELNMHKKDIYNNKKETEKLSKKADDVSVMLTKLERKQTAELSEIKNRMRDIERRGIQNGFDQKARAELDDIKNKLESLTIKVTNTSKIIDELEKVL